MAVQADEIPHIFDVPSETSALRSFPLISSAVVRLLAQYRCANPPGAFVIGIHGAWGSGKTSLMQHIAAGVVDDPSNTTRLVLRIQFDAWKYNQRESLWRALLVKVLSELIREFNMDDERLAKAETTKGEDPFAERIVDIQRRIYNDYAHSHPGVVRVKWEALGKVLLGVAQQKWGDAVSEAARAFDREQIVEFRKRIESLDDFKAEFEKLREASDRDWLILIDDLDRCLPESAIEIFEATKVFLDLKKVIFLLAVDKETVRKGLRARYGEANGRPLVDADQYIEKVTNISISLPSLPKPTEFLQKIREQARLDDEAQSKHLAERALLEASKSKTPPDKQKADNAAQEARAKEISARQKADRKKREDDRVSEYYPRAVGSDESWVKVCELLNAYKPLLQPNARRWIRLLNTGALYWDVYDKKAPPRFAKWLCLSYGWGAFIAVTKDSWSVMGAFEEAARRHETDFEAFRAACRLRFEALAHFADDQELFEILKMDPPLGGGEEPDELGELF